MKEFFVNLIFINKYDPKMVWLRQVSLYNSVDI
jgi:hypothetical protein